MANRRAARVDANQNDVVDLFRRLGCSVLILSAVGEGCLDLLVGVKGVRPVTILVEVKDGSKSPSRRKLTPDQVAFLRAWRGAYCVVETLTDVQRVVEDVRDHSFSFMDDQRLLRLLELEM